MDIFIYLMDIFIYFDKIVGVWWSANTVDVEAGHGCQRIDGAEYVAVVER